MSDCSSILCVNRVVRIVFRVIHWLSRTVLSSNCCNVVENDTSHNHVTGPFGGDLKPAKALQSGLEHPNSHFSSGSCSAVSQVITLLRARLRIRVRSQQIGLAEIPSVPEQIAIKLSFITMHLKFSVAIQGNKILHDFNRI